MIPLIVHQTEESADLLSQPVVDAMAEFRALNPDVDFRFYDADERRAFIAAHFPAKVLNAYDAIGEDYGVARADLFRYCAVYHSGGFYSDVKSVFSKRLVDVAAGHSELLLIANEAQVSTFLAHSDPEKFKSRYGTLIGNSTFAAPPENRFLKAIIDAIVDRIENYKPHLHGVGLKGVFYTTGPYAVTHTLAARDDKADITFVSAEQSGYVFRRGNSTRKEAQPAGRRHYSCNFTPVVKFNPNISSRVAWQASCVLAAVKYSPGVLEGRLKHLLQ